MNPYRCRRILGRPGRFGNAVDGHTIIGFKELAERRKELDARENRINQREALLAVRKTN